MPSRLEYGPGLKESDLPEHARRVLLSALEQSRNPVGYLTSLTRSPADQARIMYGNCERYGVDAQRELYAAPGREVIAVYQQCKATGKDERTTRACMELKIIELGPERVSHHCADPKRLAVVDLAPSKLKNPRWFETAIAQRLARGEVSKLLTPAQRDPAYHVEIPIPV